MRQLADKHGTQQAKKGIDQKRILPAHHPEQRIAQGPKYGGCQTTGQGDAGNCAPGLLAVEVYQ